MRILSKGRPKRVELRPDWDVDWIIYYPILCSGSFNLRERAESASQMNCACRISTSSVNASKTHEGRDTPPLTLGFSLRVLGSLLF